jgi:hypothetical protein
LKKSLKKSSKKLQIVGGEGRGGEGRGGEGGWRIVIPMPEAGRRQKI